MPTSKRQSLLAPPLWPFKNLEIQREVDGSLSFSQRGIEHICQLNSIPNGIFLEPHPDESPQVADARAVAWISEWNALTPHPHWQLIPGKYRANQEVLVFHWYLIYRLYGCVPDPRYESAFLQRVRDLASEAAGLHMHLLEGARTHDGAGQKRTQGAATRQQLQPVMNSSREAW